MPARESIAPTVELFPFRLPGETVGLAFCPDGYMVVASSGDAIEKVVFRVSPDGKLSALTTLECLAFQYLKADNEYIYASVIIEKGKAQVIRIAPDGKQTVLADGFIQPAAIVFDSDGNLLVADAMAGKVYRIMPDLQKSVYIDLSAYDVSSSNLYHGMAMDSGCRNLYLAGINIKGGTGNLLKFPIQGGAPGKPKVLMSMNARHVALDGYDTVYTTADNSTVFVFHKDDVLVKKISDPAMGNGMFLCFGTCEFGTERLYINSFDRIVSIDTSN